MLLQDFSQREGAVLTRNLNDTGYAARCLLVALRLIYPAPERYVRVVARPGQLTAVLRRAWGFDKDRSDVRHHALDALITATASDRILHELSHARRNGQSALAIAVPLPWDGFRSDALAALDRVAVSRSETRRGRGSAHGHTVRRARVDECGERMLYERRPIHRLRLADLARVPDPEMNAPLIAALRAWFDAGSPSDAPPRSPQGDVIRRVRLKLIGSTGIPRDGLPIRGGIAAYGDLIRLDLFDHCGRFAMVPVYAVEAATLSEPPDLAVVRAKQRKDWFPIGSGHRFLFSIYRNSLLRITRRNGEVAEGFFRSADLFSMRLVLADPFAPGALTKVPLTSAISVEKFFVDRLGRRHAVPRETRTWGGATVP